MPERACRRLPVSWKAMEDKEGVLEILTYPDPILKTVAEPVEAIDGEVQDLIDHMIETMHAAPGIGLAANQVGELRRVIVFERHPGTDEKAPFALINPVVASGEGRIVWSEACLSVPDYTADVNRTAHVLVRGIDRHGKTQEIEADDLLAVCLQHEIDHLDGVLYIDHISSLKRSMYKRRLQKRLKNP